MTKDEQYRFWLHAPVGGVAAWLTFELAALGIMAMVSFLFYEAIQDWRKKDRSYKDVIGAVTFYFVVGAVLLILKKAGIY